MVVDLVKSTMKYTIFLALIGLFIVWAFNLNSQFVYDKSITVGNYTATMKYFDWFKYSNTVSNIWNTQALTMETILPTRQWDDTASWTNWDGLFNNLAYLFQWMYFPLNFILYLIRWIAWLWMLFLGTIGWDLTKNPAIAGEQWQQYNSILIKILGFISEKLIIPYF